MHMLNRFTLRSVFGGLVAIAGVVACSGSTTTTSSSQDAGGAANDSGGASTDGAATGTDSGPVSALVAQCQALAQNFATLCAGDDIRPCLWGAYAKLCATGHTQLLIDSMMCLDQNTCRTFSDANGGKACLATVHSTGESSAAKSYVQSQCTACSGTMCTTVSGTAEIYPYLTDADLATLGTCAGTSCLSTIPTACEGNADLAYFSACTTD